MLEAAYAEFESAFPPENWARYQADVLDLERRALNSELLVAELHGEILGCVSYDPPGARPAYPSDAFSQHWPPNWSALRVLAVAPSARGRGVGRLLTEA